MTRKLTLSDLEKLVQAGILSRQTVAEALTYNISLYFEPSAPKQIAPIEPPSEPIQDRWEILDL